jgi:4-hydroxybenzoate polyprenyltransferase
VGKALTKIAKFVTSTSLLLAVDGPLIVLFGYFLYGVQIEFVLLVAASLSVFAVYSLNKATDKIEDSINRPETASKSKKYYVVPSVAAIVVSLVLGITVNLLAVAILMAPLVIGLLYSVKISGSLPRLKEITGVKSLMVAFSWSLYGAFLPLVMQPAGFDKIFLVFVYIFIQVFVNTILFDFLDMKGDLASGTRTLPIKLGRNRTKKLLFLSNSVLCLWLVFCGFSGLFLNFMPALIFGVIYGYVLIWNFSREGIQRLHAELMVDGQWVPVVAIMRLFLR